MKIYSPGAAVTEIVRFVDQNGDPVVPTAASVRVIDGTGVELVGSTPVVFAPGDTEIEVLVGGTHNMLQDGESQAIRVIELTMTTAAGAIVAFARYIIRAAQRLVLLKNSFQTFDEALLEATDMPRMSGWSIADDQSKMASLIEAHDRLTRIGYRVQTSYATSMSRLKLGEADVISPLAWPEMTVDEYIGLPARFRRALRRAQIAEADVVLNGDVIAGRRRAGLMSESIGESSMMFRPGKPLNFGVSEQALAYLSGFVDIRVGLGRA